MRFTAADEDRRTTIAVTRGTAALLLAEFLAGAGNVRTLTRAAGGAATAFELPGYDAVENIRPRFDTKDRFVQFDVRS